MATPPTMKCEVAITLSLKSQNFIALCATADAASTLSKFGTLDAWGHGSYHLYVDSRYDFDEVVKWIEDTYPRKP